MLPVPARYSRSGGGETHTRRNGKLKKRETAREPKKDERANNEPLTLDDIILAALERGLTMSDANTMTLGQVVDFCEAYNERQERAEKLAEQKQEKPRKRKASQADINAWFG